MALLQVIGSVAGLLPCDAAGSLIKSYAIESSVYNAVNQASQLNAGGQFDAARSLLSKAAANDPTSYSADLHKQLAKSYEGLKQYDKAISELKTVLHFNASRDDAMYQIGSIYLNTDRPSQAVPWFRRYAQAQADPAQRASAEKTVGEMISYANIKSAEKLIQVKRDKAAIKILDEAAAFDPTAYSGAIHANLCFALRRSGQPGRAVTEGKKALGYDSNNKSTVYSLAMAYSDLATYDQAIAWLKRYIQMEEDPQQREDANGFLQCLADDRQQANDPVNKSVDYLVQVDDGKARWAKQRLPLRVHIKSGAGVFGYRPTFDNYIKKAFDTWCAASGNKLDYTFTKDADKADIRVKWTKAGLEKVDSKHVVPDGITYSARSAAGDLQSADIVIQTVDPFDTKEPVQDGVCATVCMHEVGHALGLQGHSTCIKDVMYYRSSPKRSCLPTSRDRATMARIYSDFPATGFKPKSMPGEGVPGEYLPPPAFVPPKLPTKEKPVPPFFMPPPLKKEPVIEPPMFTPPPLSGLKGEGAGKAEPAMPAFTPPPIKKNDAKKQAPPMFVPPPLSR